MAPIRCTCIYRLASSDEQARIGSPLVVACRDPRCPAGAVHEHVPSDRGATADR